MDLRREPGTKVDIPVMVRVLPQGLSFPARMADLCQRRMRLIVEDALPPNALLAITEDAFTYLGEVLYCTPSEGTWLVGVDIDQYFCETADLMNLREALGAESQAARSPSCVRSGR